MAHPHQRLHLCRAAQLQHLQEPLLRATVIVKRSIEGFSIGMKSMMGFGADMHRANAPHQAATWGLVQQGLQATMHALRAHTAPSEAQPRTKPRDADECSLQRHAAMQTIPHAEK